MTNLQPQEEKSIHNDWLERYFDKFGGNDRFMNLDYFEVRTFILEEIEKSYALGQQDMLEMVREIISDKIDGLRINNSSIFEHGDYYKKEDILKALDNLKKQI